MLILIPKEKTKTSIRPTYTFHCKLRLNTFKKFSHVQRKQTISTIKGALQINTLTFCDKLAVLMGNE